MFTSPAQPYQVGLVSNSVIVTNSPTVGLTPGAAVGIVGTVPVAGNVGVTSIPAVDLAAGSTVSLVAGTEVSLPTGQEVAISGTVPVSGTVGVGGTVTLAAGTEVSLPNGQQVALAAGTAVGIVGTPSVAVPGGVTNTPASGTIHYTQDQSANSYTVSGILNCSGNAGFAQQMVTSGVTGGPLYLGQLCLTTNLGQCNVFVVISPQAGSFNPSLGATIGTFIVSVNSPVLFDFKRSLYIPGTSSYEAVGIKCTYNSSSGAGIGYTLTADRG